MNRHPSRFKRSMSEIYPNSNVWSGPYRRSDRQWKWIDRGMGLALCILLVLVILQVI